MIINLCFMTLWLILPFIWHKLLKVAHLNLLKPNIPTILILFIYLFQYIGFPILYFQLDSYRFSEGVNDRLLVFQVFLYTSITITLLIISFIFAKIVFGNLTCNKNNTHIHMKTNIFIFILYIISLSVLILYIQKIGVNNLAILNILGITQNDTSLTMLRSTMGNSISGYHWYYLFMNKILILLAYIYYAKAMMYKNRSKIMLYVVMLTVIFSLVMATEKGPLMTFIIGLFFLHTLAHTNKINFIQSFKVFILIIAILSAFYIFFMNDKNILSALWSILSRTTTGSIQPAYHYLEFFPKHQDYLLGRSFPNPMHMFPFEPYRLTVEVMAWHNPEEAAKGIVGTMPTIFWGEMYANFSIFGILIAPMFVGFILYFINYLLTRLPNNELTLAFLIWVAMHFSSLSITSLSNYFIDIHLIIGTIIFFVLLFINGNGQITYTNKEYKRKR